MVVTFTVAANSPPPELSTRIPVMPLISTTKDLGKTFALNASSIAVAPTFAIAYDDNRNSVFLLLLLLLLYSHSRLDSQDFSESSATKKSR